MDMLIFMRRICFNYKLIYVYVNNKCFKFDVENTFYVYVIYGERKGTSHS